MADGESKLISVKTGKSSVGVSSKLISKSVGIGKSSGMMSFMFLDVVSGTTDVVLGVPYCAAIRSMLRWARSNMLRISMGIFRACVVGADCVSGCSGADVGCGGTFFVVFCACSHDGFGMVNNGFFVRTINTVVDTYNGIAANINMPNTRPGNPRSPACAI